MTHQSITLPTDLGNTKTTATIHTLNKSHQNMVYPSVKKAGFSERLALALKNGLGFIWTSLRTYMKRRQDRIIATQFLSMDEHILDDLALTKGDVCHVLATASPALATERLRLIGLERRVQQRADFRRRADYLSDLTPAIPSVPRGDRQIEKVTG